MSPFSFITLSHPVSGHRSRFINRCYDSWWVSKDEFCVYGLIAMILMGRFMGLTHGIVGFYGCLRRVLVVDDLPSVGCFIESFPVVLRMVMMVLLWTLHVMVKIPDVIYILVFLGKF